MTVELVVGLVEVEKDVLVEGKVLVVAFAPKLVAAYAATTTITMITTTIPIQAVRESALLR